MDNMPLKALFDRASAHDVTLDDIQSTVSAVRREYAEDG